MAFAHRGVLIECFVTEAVNEEKGAERKRGMGKEKKQEKKPPSLLFGQIET